MCSRSFFLFNNISVREGIGVRCSKYPNINNCTSLKHRLKALNVYVYSD